MLWNKCIFDLNGNFIKNIDSEKYQVLFIDSYNEFKTDKNFIIVGNYYDVKSYDFDEGEIYHIYKDKNDNTYGHVSLIINNKEEIIKLIESCFEGNIKIWNFHSGELLNKINIGLRLYGMDFWDNKFLLVGCRDSTIKIIDINEQKIIKELAGHIERVLTVKKIIHPQYGECLVSLAEEEQIKLWGNKKPE